MADILAILRANIEDFTAKMSEARAEMDSTEKKGSTSFSKLKSLGGAALLGIGAAAVGVGIASVDMADKFEVSHARLTAAMSAAGISYKANAASIDATSAAATRFGFTASDIQGALATGIISTQNYASAHRNLTIAIQLAAARHVDLASAMSAVDKAATGQTRALKQMGIDLPVVASNALKVKQAQDALKASQTALITTIDAGNTATSTSTKAHAAYEAAINGVAVKQQKLTELQDAHLQVLDALSQRLSGQAAAAADTFGGRIAAIRAQGENMAATLGLKLIPILERLMTTVMGVVSWFEKHKAIAEALGIVIGTVLVAALVAATVALFTAGGALAFLIGPIGLVVAAVALLAVGAVYLATHWQQVWSDIKQWTADAVDWVKSHLLLVIGAGGPIGLMIAAAVELGTHWKAIWDIVKGAVSDAWNMIKPIFDAIVSGVGDVTHAIGAVTSAIGSVAHIGGSIVGGVASFLSGHAEGGSVAGNVPIIVGEKGPEIFVPSGAGQIIPNSAFTTPNTTTSSTTASAAAPSAGMAPVINITGVNLQDPNATASAVGWALRTAPVGR